LPNTPRTAYDAISKAIERLNNDKEFAAEAVKTIEFAPDYVTSPDMSEKIRGMLHASPEMRAFINANRDQRWLERNRSEGIRRHTMDSVRCTLDRHHGHTRGELAKRTAKIQRRKGS